MAMQFPVLNSAGQEVSQVELPSDIFAAKINVGLMHQAFVRQMANARQGTHSTRSRGQIRATGGKWYRQKGTGRARHGAQSAPIFVGGGLAHGPKPRDYTKKMPRKMRQGAIRSTLSALVRDGQLVLLDELAIDAPKTKAMRQLIEALVGDQSALIVVTAEQKAVRKSVSNLANAHSIVANFLNVRDLLKYDKVIMPLASLDVITSLWSKGN
ncbi:MAG: 50S ribosomal protein L4 [Chloroflexi bacterium]|nr:50S ribosomal protein L4 [Chloroflexota bacterium]MXX83865.1 50S ribosomal protein L4 [Chloroflexota bacterium]MYA93527.1 50S ribosomal protein L4 [Chloroflexota bacterium]MYC56853.1 50S ribosomal protein L4 [Chloroflexota bacterium]MYD38965.1 50S ribosomal protein L4 [Chloroflexota bacterium]